MVVNTFPQSSTKGWQNSSTPLTTSSRKCIQKTRTSSKTFQYIAKSTENNSNQPFSKKSHKWRKFRAFLAEIPIPLFPQLIQSYWSVMSSTPSEIQWLWREGYSWPWPCRFSQEERTSMHQETKSTAKQIGRLTLVTSSLYLFLAWWPLSTPFRLSFQHREMYSWKKRALASTVCFLTSSAET